MNTKIGWTVIFACVTFSVLFPSRIQAEKPTADLVVVNANIITIDADNPRAEAFAVIGERIIAVGSTSEMKALIDKATIVIDARGKTITPGFNDAHLHPGPIYPYQSIHHSIDVSPKSIQTMDELIHALREKASITPKGQWVRGSRYQDTKLGRHPTRRDLDKASTEHPIRISHSSGHVSVVNSYALNAAEITSASPDPPGGAFDRDENGEPNGILRERASGIVTAAGPKTPPPTREEQLEGILICFNNFYRDGITSIQDAGGTTDKLELYQDALESGALIRISVMIRDRYLPDLKKVKIRNNFGSDRLKIGAIKTFQGNSLSGRTCWLYEPYVNRTDGRTDYYGIPPGRSQEEFEKLIYEIHEAGFSPAVHSNGDRENDLVLDAFEKALQKLPKKDHRFRIEHCSVVNPRILKRIKDLGVVIVPHSYIYEHGDKHAEYGEERWDWMHPNGSAVEMGIPVAGNSDYSVSAAVPLLRIQSMVTRTSAEGKVYGPMQRVTAEEAIRIWTLGSAYASYEEDIKGSIEVGKLADFVILSADPTKVDPFTIKDIKVEKTIIGGKIVYEL